MVKITQENFNYVSQDRKPSEKNSQVAFRRANPELWLMIRPDRPHDRAAHRYPDRDAKARGDRAMKLWFEYLAAKEFIATLKAWLSMLKSGQSIMVVCDDPGLFDTEFVPPVNRVLSSVFWDEFERSRAPIDRRFDDPAVGQHCLAIINDCSDELRKKSSAFREEKKPRTLREWTSTPASMYADKPLPPLSAELRAKLSAGIPEITE